MEKIIELKNINTKEALLDFAEKKGMSHKIGYHYTSLQGLRGIYNSEEFWFKNTRVQNDLDESYNNFRNDANKFLYTASFCHCSEENLGQWYMYGDAGNGFRIEVDLTHIVAQVRKSVKFVDCDNKEQLIENDDYSVCIADVIYYEIQDNKCILFYDGEQNINFNASDFNDIRREKPYFKEKIWAPEQETRILIYLKQECASRIINRGGMNDNAFLLTTVNKNVSYGEVVAGPNTIKNAEVYLPIKRSVCGGHIGSLVPSRAMITGMI